MNDVPKHERRLKEKPNDLVKARCAELHEDVKSQRSLVEEAKATLQARQEHLAKLEAQLEVFDTWLSAQKN